MSRWFPLVLVLLCLPAALDAQIYSWIDENGVPTFSDRPRLPVASQAAGEAAPPLEVVDKREATLAKQRVVVPPRNINPHVVLELHDAFKVYVFQPPYRLQPFDMELDGDSLWVSQDQGLLRFQIDQQAWVAYGQEQGFPADTIMDIGVFNGSVFASTFHRKTHEKGYSYLDDLANLVFSPALGTWEETGVGCTPTRIVPYGRQLLIAGRGAAGGVRLYDPQSREAQVLNSQNSALVHSAVSGFVLDGNELVAASLGTARGAQGWEGGGVSLLTLPGGEGRHFGVEAGLADAYCHAVETTPGKIWAAHFKEERGLSVYDRASGRWEVLATSRNGIPLGGVALQGVGRHLVIGQQGGVVFLNTETLEARRFKEQDGLPGYIVSDLAVGRGALWVLMYGYGSDPETRRTFARASGLVRFDLANLPIPGAQ